MHPNLPLSSGEEIRERISSRVISMALGFSPPSTSSLFVVPSLTDEDVQKVIGNFRRSYRPILAIVCRSEFRMKMERLALSMPNTNHPGCGIIVYEKPSQEEPYRLFYELGDLKKHLST